MRGDMVKTGILDLANMVIQVLHGTYEKITPQLHLLVNNSIKISSEVINKDYKGQIKILLTNHSDIEFLVQQSVKNHLTNP